MDNNCKNCISALVMHENETEKSAIARNEHVMISYSCINKQYVGWHVQFSSLSALRYAYFKTNKNILSCSTFHLNGSRYESNSVYFGDTETFIHKDKVFVVKR